MDTFTVNTHRDTVSYDCYSYPRGLSPLLDANALYRGFKRSMAGSSWKSQVQKFELNFLTEILKLQDELESETYRPAGSMGFILHERGKTRMIKGENIRDRCVKHVLCDDILTPSLQPLLIHDNGASIKNKGISFTRNRLVCHLRKYYSEYGNDGYILLTDYSKFYDNILHERLKQILLQRTDDKTAEFLIDIILEKERIDVSYLSDSEYTNCLNVLFDSLEYAKIPPELKTGQKYMHKHMDIGDQLAQIAGIAYPTEIDNYIKIVRGIKYYSRYMDDSYIIHHDRNFLKDLKYDLIERAAKIGITMHERKTYICKLSDYWRFLQLQYSLTDTGRIIRKINPKALTRMRKKTKKTIDKIPAKVFDELFFSWYYNYRKYMSHKQKQNLMILYNELKGNQNV